MQTLRNLNNNNARFRFQIQINGNGGVYSFRKSEMLGVYNTYISSQRYITHKKRSKYTRDKREWREFISNLNNESYVSVKKRVVEIDLNLFQ